jgi:hypothetical protein
VAEAIVEFKQALLSSSQRNASQNSLKYLPLTLGW